LAGEHAKAPSWLDDRLGENVAPVGGRRELAGEDGVTRALEDGLGGNGVAIVGGRRELAGEFGEAPAGNRALDDILGGNVVAPVGGRSESASKPEEGRIPQGGPAPREGKIPQGGSAPRDDRMPQGGSAPPRPPRLLDACGELPCTLAEGGRVCNHVARDPLGDGCRAALGVSDTPLLT